MIEVYNFLDGKNLCNIFASLIVEKIEELVPNSHTEISVISVGYFFVIKGFTTAKVENPIFCNSIFTEFLSAYYETPPVLKIFDFIEYSVDYKPKDFNINLKFDKFESGFINNLKSEIDTFKKSGINLNIHVDPKNKNLFYDCEIKNTKKILNFFDSKFRDYTISVFKPTETYISDRYYGLSECLEKKYIKLLKNITYLLSIRGIISKLDISLTILNTDDFEYKISINNIKSIVKEEWLMSLILDVFPFEKESISNFFTKDNSIKELIESDYNSSWKKMEIMKDILLI